MCQRDIFPTCLFLTIILCAGCSPDVSVLSVDVDPFPDVEVVVEMTARGSGIREFQVRKAHWTALLDSLQPNGLIFGTADSQTVIGELQMTDKEGSETQVLIFAGQSDENIMFSIFPTPAELERYKPPNRPRYLGGSRDAFDAAVAQAHEASQ